MLTNIELSNAAHLAIEEEYDEWYSDNWYSSTNEWCVWHDAEMAKMDHVNNPAPLTRYEAMAGWA